MRFEFYYKFNDYPINENILIYKFFYTLINFDLYNMQNLNFV